MKYQINSFLLAFALAFAGQVSADNHVSDPSTRISDAAGRILSLLNENHAEYTEKPELLSDVVRNELLPLLDLEYSARLILGRSGRGATADQIDRFGKAMGDLLADRYSVGLLQFRSEDQLQVLPMKGEIKERMTRVRSRVRLNSGGTAPVDYVCHMTDQGWQIFDIIVEGISYVTTYRSQIMPEVQEKGLDAVIERLNAGELVLAD